jgi:hypothetical protein
VIAYWLGRGLAWRRPGAAHAAGTLAAVAVLLPPAMLVRDDLKQYTADACAALLTLAMMSRLERHWSRRALGALAATVVVGMLFSDAASFAGAAAFVAICAVELARRYWRRLAEAAATGGVRGWRPAVRAQPPDTARRHPGSGPLRPRARHARRRDPREHVQQLELRLLLAAR